MTILLTGGAGYIGRATAKVFADYGHSVIVLDRKTPSTPFCVIGNVQDPEKVRRAITMNGVEIVVHLAASTENDMSLVHPVDFYDNNLAASISLLKTALGCGVKKFVFASSAAVYAGQLTPYAWSKLIFERVLFDAALAYEGFSHVTLRYFNIYGGQGGKGFINNVLSGQRPVRVFGADYPTRDGTCIRDYVHVDDVAQANLIAVGMLHAGHRSVAGDVGTGVGTTVFEALKMMEVSDYEIKPPRKGDILTSVASPCAELQARGWRPRSLMDGLRGSVRVEHVTNA